MKFKYIEFEYIVKDIVIGFTVLRTEDLNEAKKFIENQDEPMLYEIIRVEKNERI